MICLDILVYVN
ncbi:hypothetical protein Taro_026282 [Colocasia esculenta]|uniref:Uncharacterized protein n=1 Tax=Colocasia esculenta TaxID=4460 RepID=A0A843V5T2_COLES|nr:hypothetical protein [Colocasia esculenta]